jgi:hypothetical protein
MAEATNIPGGYFNLLVSNGATPPVFTYLCGVTTNELTVVTNGNDQFIPDCDDPDKVLIRRRVNISEQADITASGTYNPDNFPRIEALRGVSAPYRFQAAVTPAMVTAGYTPSYLEGNFVLNGYTIGGTRGDGTFGTLTGMSFASDGEFDWVFGDVPDTTP